MNRIYFDVTDTILTKNNTGIQRVVKKTLQHLTNAHDSVDVVPVVSYKGEFHRIALTVSEVLSLNSYSAPGNNRSVRTYLKTTIRKILCQFTILELLAKRFYNRLRVRSILKPIILDKISPNEADILYLCDYLFGTVPVLPAAEHFKKYSKNIFTLFYDVIPVTHPEFFDGSVFAKLFDKQMHDIVSISKKLITISQTSRSEFLRLYPYVTLPIDVHLLGAELPVNSKIIKQMADITHHKLFLAVGTVEPRKNYDVLISAMEINWLRGSPDQLIIIGKDGWKNDVVKNKISNLQKLGYPISWLKEADDATLENYYSKATAVICASKAEGFGLPVIEAQLFHKRVIASEIAVFKELASPNITYFHPDDPDNLAKILFNYSPPPFVPVKIPSWEDYSRSIYKSLV